MCRNLLSEAKQHLYSWGSPLKDEIVQGLDRKLKLVYTKEPGHYNDDEKFRDDLCRALDLRQAVSHVKVVLSSDFKDCTAQDPEKVVDLLREMLEGYGGPGGGAVKDALGSLEKAGKWFRERRDFHRMAETLSSVDSSRFAGCTSGPRTVQSL